MGLQKEGSDLCQFDSSKPRKPMQTKKRVCCCKVIGLGSKKSVYGGLFGLFERAAGIGPGRSGQRPGFLRKKDSKPGCLFRCGRPFPSRSPVFDLSPFRRTVLCLADFSVANGVGENGP